MESGERLGILVAHSVEAPGEGKQWETRTKEGAGHRLDSDSDSVAVSVSDGLKKRPGKSGRA
ncbi:hypothetical protein N7491_003240 [Penicillium cf. griseofulvum]|uniref:Uncharacterized protein n=1 Tax=Penicillium cf. griseofulvum TaxID=2972120 RepID=A0A9W9MRF6_9EURO|nr:hypothetical protein N7472_002589 [Penicillium cf. griseofulvum]KAJ5440834.1 hypothetical protein N7491_003240 [Penicillium cf. griseofulvum]